MHDELPQQGHTAPLFRDLLVGSKKRLKALHEEMKFRERFQTVLGDGSKGGEEDDLKSRGPCQALVRNWFFQVLTFVVIVANVLWIWVDTDYNSADILCNAAPVFQVMSNVFCAFFSFEIFVRWEAFRHKRTALHTPWFVFDFLLTASMVWETWVQPALYVFLTSSVAKGGAGTSVLRVLRVFRVTRVTRLVRRLPELMILVKGVLAGLRSVIAILVLWIIMLYVFSITFRQWGTFETVPKAMHLLLSQVLCGFSADLFNQMLEEGWAHYITFLCFMLLASFMLVNMLIGILCQVVSDVSAEEKLSLLERELSGTVDGLSRTFDVRNSGVITHVELKAMANHPEELRCLMESGIDLPSFFGFLHLFLSEDSNAQLSWTDFKHLVLQHHSSKSITLKDLMDHRRFFALELARLESMLEKAASVHRNMVTDRGAC